MRRRIVICLALLLAICLAGDLIAMLCLRTSIDRLAAVAESHRIQTMRANLASSGVRIQRDVLAHGQGAGGLPVEPDSLHRFEESLEACGSCHHAPEVAAQLDELRATVAAYHAHAAQLEAATSGPGPLLDAESERLLAEMVRQASSMSDQASRHIAWESERVQASVRRAWGVLCGSIILLLVVGGVIALHLKRRITAPLEALLDGIDRVGHGDLTHRMVFAGDEEFRRLGEAFNRANESLARAQSGLLRAERMAAVGQMATGIAHEVGNPLASISSVVQMMRRGSHIPQDQQRLELIMHHIGRVSQIVRELLTFSRSRPEQAMQRQVNLNELLDQTLSLLQYDKRAANARIVCDCDTNLTLEQADPNRLALVFTNICLNAFDALNGKSQEGGYLRISAAREGQRVILNFEDNGEGMSSQQIRHAFEPFYTTKEPGSGTGLGLWICYQIIQDHGGTIAIGSHPGQGTKVTIELPDRPPREHSASIPFRRPMEESRNVVDA